VVSKRQETVDLLLRAGLSDLAAKAEVELPDPVKEDDLAQWCRDHGLSRDWLTSLMGGSP
jgi:hypothetical protein